MAFPYATLCVQGIKDGTSRSALFSQFEDYGRVNDVTITPNKHMRGQPDSKIALVEFERKEDARKAMQALNGRQVQGKCVMIRFARSAPGVRPPGPLPRHGAPELIPQTAGMAKLINQKFKPADGDSESPRRDGRSRSRRRSRDRRSHGHKRDKDGKDGKDLKDGRDDKDARRGRSKRRSRERSRGRSRRAGSRRRSRSRRGGRPSGGGGPSVAAGRRDRSDRSPSRWRPGPSPG